MIGHHRCFPHLNLRIELMHLRQFFLNDYSPQIAQHDVWKIRCVALCPDISLKPTEERLSPLDTQRNHIQSAAAIVLPFSAAVLVVLNIMRRYSSAQQFFFRGRHQCFFLYY